LILAKCQQYDLVRGLKAWQRGRQDRIDRVLDLNAQIDAQRMPKDPASNFDSKPFDLAWLYSPNFDEMAEGWLAKTGIV
jgi:hypothetical protein